MRIKKYIFQGLSIFMLLCVFTTQVSAMSVQVSYSVSSDDDKQQAEFRQLTHETVVPSYDFSFGDFNAFFDNAFYPSIIRSKSFQQTLKFPQPESTYRAKIFEHHIASNAP